jgi:hypothetical protein
MYIFSKGFAACATEAGQLHQRPVQLFPEFPLLNDLV